MGAKCLLAAAKRGVISSLSSSSPPRSSGWLALYRSPRIGRHAWVISIPKKVVAKSVRRSRVRRLIREAARALVIDPPMTEVWRFAVKADPPKTIGMSEVLVAMAKLVDKK